MNYAIQILYKGTNYHGWQIQDNAHSVQEELNKVLERLLNHPIKTVGSGRTDTGVHAKEQYVMFQSDLELDSYQHVKSLNGLLPKDIAVHGIFKIADKANVRFDAISRAYEYRICRRNDPFEKEYSAFLPYDLDFEKMNQGAEFLLSQKDFSSFAKSGSAQSTSICQIYQAAWKKEGYIWTFEIKADRFLRNMVRAVVGTLVEIGEGRISLEDLKEIVKTKNRSHAGRSMPASGLFLMEVKYPEGYFQKF
jgi:tRNA pseudouridine38-40 synthase